jgi:DNA-binding NtrC family response regulator
MMAQATLLLADNDLDFLETRAEFLERDGYTVIPASSPAEAAEKMKNVDLAIVDVRLINDDDEKDTSGLDLANRIGHSIPIIILTGYPNVDYVRQALRPQVDGHQAALDFVIKEEGPKIMLAAVRNALHVSKTEEELNKKSDETGKNRFLAVSQLRPEIALIILLIALGQGIIAMVSRDPRWLVGTVALTVLAVFYIRLMELGRHP